MTRERKLSLENEQRNPLKRPEVRGYFTMWAGRELPRNQWENFNTLADSGGLTSAFHEIEKRMETAEPYQRDRVISEVVLPIMDAFTKKHH